MILIACMLMAYMMFMYLSVHMSYSLSHAKDTLVEKEHTLQKEQERYVAALESFRTSEDLAAEGFTKISSPTFLSRTTSVAFQGQ